tara:strand:+ start:410 stop:562 length:153 start_codon:yes stop_codon:yes gene_type:complete
MILKLNDAIPKMFASWGGSCVFILRDKNNIGVGFLKKMGQHYNVSPIRGG